MIVQPGAKLGGQTYCPVSGVVFEIKDASAKRSSREHTFYFCCEACAKHFDEHRAQISAARGYRAER